VLGSAVVSLLEKDGGYDLRLTDMVDLDTEHEFVKADLSKSEEAAPLCDGVEELMHIAAIHPWKKYTPEQYMDCNIKGTYNILESAARAEVKRVIYTSSVAAMGYKASSPDELPFDETKPCTPTEDIYGVSKYVGELFCKMFAARDGLDYLALRPGGFVPTDESDPQFGFHLLGIRVNCSDVAQAHLLALKKRDVRNEAFVITAGVPFTREDTPALLTDAPPVIRRYFPQVRMLEQRGIHLPKTLTRFYSIEKARRLLGYEPKFNFQRWLASQTARKDDC